MKDYTDMRIGSRGRMAALKSNADALNDRAYNQRKAQGDTRPYTWRDVRYCGLHNYHAAQCCLSQGFNDNKPIWYCHTGPAFPREKFADECDSVRIDHTGWYADKHGDQTIRGIVVALPHGRFLAGYYSNDNGERVYFSDLYNDERTAAYAADSEAQTMAESEREYNFRWHEANDIHDKIDNAAERLRECLALRNNPCFAKLRGEVGRLITDIREWRETLANDFADIEL